MWYGKHKKIKDTINRIKREIEKAETKAELISIVQNIDLLKPFLSYNKNFRYLLAGIISIFILFNLKHVITFLPDLLAIIIGYIIFSLAISLIFKRFGYNIKKPRLPTLKSFFKTPDPIKDLSKLIYSKKLLLDNGLKEIETYGWQAEYLLDHFAEFKRFNRAEQKFEHSRELKTLYQGQYRNKEYFFSYYYYHLQHTIYDQIPMLFSPFAARFQKRWPRNYHRYGICMSFKFASDLLIVSTPDLTSRKPLFKPASNAFNKYYRIIADTELAAAKFLRPSTIVTLENMASLFEQIDIEFNDQSEINISFTNGDVLTGNQQYDINDIDNFIEEIEQTDILPDLRLLCESIYKLMIYSDSNFYKID